MSQPEYDFRERCKELEEELADDREVFREEITRLRKLVEAKDKALREIEDCRDVHRFCPDCAKLAKAALELK